MIKDWQKTNVLDKIRFMSPHMAIITSLLIISALLNFLLAQKIKRLENELKNDTEIIEKAEALFADSIVPSLQVIDLKGQPTIISYQEIKKPVVLYIFSPSCNWCERNAESIRLLAQTRNKEYQFIGVSLSSNQLDEHLQRTNLPFSIYHSPSLEVSQTYRFGRTPQTLVISPEGRVIKNWFGVYGNLYGKTRNLKLKVFFKSNCPV